jgi:flagellar biosynthesis GTPase FlhF
VTEPTRCLGRSERDALQRAHIRHPQGFEIVEWRRASQNRRTPVELLVRPVGGRSTAARARLRLLASVNAIQAQARQVAEAFDVSRLVVDTPSPRGEARQVWAFIGAPGSGVTRVVCALASRLNGRDRCGVGMLSAGDEIHSHAMRGFSDATGLPMQSATNPADLAEAAASLGHRSLVLADFPGVGPRDGDRLVSHARALQALAPSIICAVVGADSDAASMRRQLEVLARLGASWVALTRTDLAARIEPALRCIEASGLSLAWIGHGAGSASDLAPASRPWIERACEREPALH